MTLMCPLTRLLTLPLPLPLRLTPAPQMGQHPRRSTYFARAA